MADASAIGSGIGTAGGAAVGSLIPGVGTAIGATAGGLLGGAVGGLFGRKKSQETETQKKQRMLVDEMLASLHGEGAYSDLFNASDEAFERSFAEPARARFRNKTAPMIQQEYIAGGQQRGTGMQDTLTRAGVDMDALLNESYMDYIQQAQNRKLDAMNNILGLGAGAAPEQGYGEAAMQGLGGYMAGPTFGKDIGNIISAITKKPSYEQPQRKGFENDYRVANPYAGSSVFAGS